MRKEKYMNAKLATVATMIIIVMILMASQVGAIKVGDIEDGLGKSKDLQSAIDYLVCVEGQINPKKDKEKSDASSSTSTSSYLLIATGCTCDYACRSTLKDTDFAGMVSSMKEIIKKAKDQLTVGEKP